MTTTTDDTTQANRSKLVRYASENSRVAQAKRDAAFREAHRSGALLREISAVSGTSHMTVKRIIERAEDRDPIALLCRIRRPGQSGG